MKKFYILLIVFTTAFVGCKSNYDAPCRNQAVKQLFSFATAQVAKFPYTKNDTIGFVSNVFDTLIFYTDTLLNTETYKISAIAGNPDCPPDVDAYKVTSAKLKNEIGISMGYTFTKENDSCEVTLNNVNSIKMAIEAIGNVGFNYQDSVALNNNVFYKVNTIVASSGDSMMVNAAKGVLFFIHLGKPYYQFKFNSK